MFILEHFRQKQEPILLHQIENNRKVIELWKQQKDHFVFVCVLPKTHFNFVVKCTAQKKVNAAR